MLARLAVLTGLVGMLSIPLACASDSDPQDLPTLQGRFAAPVDAEPLIADLAYIGEEDFYVRFRRGDRTYHGGGNWAERIPVLRIAEEGRHEGPYLLPLQYQQTEPWDDLRGYVRRARILGVDDWRALRERLFAAVLAKSNKDGVVLHFNVDDYFLYYNEEGEFQATVIDAKPGDYEVSRRVDIADLVGMGLPLLEAFLEERGIEERRVAFNTGDSGFYSLPFVYINRDLPVVVFVRLPGPARQVLAAPGPAPYDQTAGQIAGIHTAGIVFRPFS